MQDFCDFNGRLIIIRQTIWNGTIEQRHSLKYTRANPEKHRKNWAQSLNCRNSSLYKARDCVGLPIDSQGRASAVLVTALCQFCGRSADSRWTGDPCLHRAVLGQMGCGALHARTPHSQQKDKWH